MTVATERVGVPSSPIACWRCENPLDQALVCGACGVPQLVGSDADPYAVLGVPRALVVDREALDASYLQASRAVHPDRHATADAAVRAASLGASAAANRAYRELRDVRSRGRRWLELHGERLANNNNQVPPALAELVFDTQEELEAFRANRGDAARRTAVTRIHGELGREVRARTERLARCYAEWDAHDATSAEVLRDLKRQLSELAYLETLVGDVDEALDD